MNNYSSWNYTELVLSAGIPQNALFIRVCEVFTRLKYIRHNNNYTELKYENDNHYQFDTPGAIAGRGRGQG